MATFDPQLHKREVCLEAEKAALIVVDVQNFCCHKNGAEWKDIPADELESQHSYYFSAMSTAVRNIQVLLRMFRQKRMEIIFTTIESLTKNGRDRSLDYKISGFNVPRGSWDAKVLDDVAPVEDEIIIPKTSSSVFISTNIQYVLRNLGITQVVLVGGVTDQCVESAIRDACDMGFLVTQVTDACYTHSAERHAFSIKAIKGYCRQRTTHEMLAELERIPSATLWNASGSERVASEPPDSTLSEADDTKRRKLQ